MEEPIECKSIKAVSLGYPKADNIKPPKDFKVEIDKTILFVFEENEYLSYVTYIDSIRPESANVIQIPSKNHIQ